MLINDINYATALFEIAKEEKKIKEYYEELVEISNIFENNKEFFIILKSFSFSLEEKEKIIDEALTKNNVSEMITNLIKLLIKKHKIGIFLNVFKQFEKLVFEHLDILKGFIYSAIELNEVQIKKIENFSAKKIGKKVILKNVVDSKLIAGVKIVIGNYVFENSIISQLEQIKKYIIKGDN